MKGKRRSFLPLGLAVLLVSSVVACSPPLYSPPPTVSSASPAAGPPTTATPPKPVPAPVEIPLASVPTKAKLKVHFIDVGQGDAILIDLGETEILIDGGENSADVVAYLNDFVDGALEVMVATHPHADHIGGLIQVLDTLEVKEIWLNGDTSDSETYIQFMLAVRSEGAQVYEARRGDIIEVDELVFNVLHPARSDNSVSDNSIVLEFSYGDTDFLFMGGGAGQEAESSMLAAGIVSAVDILKIGDHGSKSALSPRFLGVVKTPLAIYMAGEGNSYGYPHQDSLTALDWANVVTYGTDIHGTIIVTTDGKTASVELEKQAPPRTAPVIRLKADIALTALSIEPAEVEPGETVVISATATNSGGIRGSHYVRLKVNDSEVDYQYIVLDAGDSRSVSFDVAKELSGIYTVDLGGLKSTFTVAEKIVAPVLGVSGTVKYPSLGDGTQTLYATVTVDGRPVQGADVRITVHYKTVKRTFVVSPTDANGKTQISWEVGRLSGGYTVQIEVVATYQGKNVTTVTGFYIP